MVLSLADILSFSEPYFLEEVNTLRQALDQLLDQQRYENTMVQYTVWPHARALRSWLGLFFTSMAPSETADGQDGVVVAQVCYAERGMCITVQLVESLLGALNASAGSRDGQLVELLRLILNVEQTGLHFMYTWLATLVALVPLDQRSNQTSLTQENMDRLRAARLKV